MNPQRLLKVIQSPRVSEKSTRSADLYKHIVFEVLSDSNKQEIKEAVEYVFNVKVDCVRTLNLHGKTKQFKRKLGKRPDIKKAYVKLMPGYDIDFAGKE